MALAAMGCECRHQHELAPAMPRDLDRLALSLTQELAELALEFQGSCLSHGGRPSQLRIPGLYGQYRHRHAPGVLPGPSKLNATEGGSLGPFGRAINTPEQARSCQNARFCDSAR
jgi:hypothetical protein